MAHFLSAASVQLTLNGHTFSGFAEGADAITMPTVPLINTKLGADGRLQAHSTGARGGDLTVTLQPNSPSHVFLQKQAALQQKGQGTIWRGTLRDPQSGLSVSLEHGYLKEYMPAGSVGKGDAKDQPYTWTFERIIPNMDGARFPQEVTNPFEALSNL